jgi:hypothetical protein
MGRAICIDDNAQTTGFVAANIGGQTRSPNVYEDFPRRSDESRSLFINFSHAHPLLVGLILASKPFPVSTSYLLVEAV